MRSASRLRVARILLLAAAVLLSQTSTAEKCHGLLGPLARVFRPRAKEAVATDVATLRDRGGIVGLSFSPDSQWLSTATSGHSDIRVWDWRKHRVVHDLEEPNRHGQGGMIGRLMSERVLFSPKGPDVVACNVGYNGGSNGFTISSVWDSASGKFLQGLVEPSNCVAIGFSPDGSRLLDLVFDGQDARTILYDTQSWQTVWKAKLASNSSPQASAISPDGLYAAIGSLDVEFPHNAVPGVLHSRIHVIDLKQGKELRAFEPFWGRNLIDRVAWSADGRQIAVGETKGVRSSPLEGATVALLDAETGQVTATEESTGSHVTVLRYTPDGRYLIEGGLGDTVEIWDGRHQQLLQEICARPESGAVSADSRYLALGAASSLFGGGKVTVWQLK
jgi:WD40 repeat protein